MGRIWLAIRIFFLVLFRREVAQRVREVLAARPETPPPAVPETAKPKPKPVAEKRPVQSEAITLLAALQREGRFVDFVQESLAGASDAQIGAAIRDVHRGCQMVVERMFALKPVVDAEEESQIEIAAGFDPGRFHLTGNLVGSPPYRGQVTHRGWEATRCELPAWSGQPSSARVVMPAEVEVK